MTGDTADYGEHPENLVHHLIQDHDIKPWSLGGSRTAQEEMHRNLHARQEVKDGIAALNMRSHLQNVRTIRAQATVIARLLDGWKPSADGAFWVRDADPRSYHDNLMSPDVAAIVRTMPHGEALEEQTLSGAYGEHKP